MQEKVIQAAIQFYLTTDSKHPIVVTGVRHCDIFQVMKDYSLSYDKSCYTQGFWTSNNRFVDRYEAKKIAVAANQLIVPIEDTYSELYSEDVW